MTVDLQRISGPSTRELRTDMGPTALELGVTSQACCFTTILALTAKKVRTPLKDLSGKYDIKVVPVKTDVSQEEQVTNMVNTAIEKFGSLEILINDTGIASLSPPVDVRLEEWKKAIDVNLTGDFLSARNAAPEMTKKYGK